MRFLLHASKKAKSPSLKSKQPPLGAAATVKTTTNNSRNENNDALTKAWGQQCSSNCGCIVRFESEIDSNNVITSASYQAKTVLTFTEQGTRQAHFVSNNNSKPLVKQCTCKTLHALSQQVISHITGKRVDQVVNSLSGGGSAAVVHASLRAQSLPLSGGACFSLVQQALTGMICGYLPSFPEKQESYRQYLYQQYASLERQEEGDGYGVDENSGISVGVSAVNILDMTYEEAAAEEEREQEEEDETPKRLTWQAYVDELYHQYSDENEGVQWSA